MCAHNPSSVINNTMEAYYCSGHQAWLARDSFYPASLAAGETRCKRCNGQSRRERRERDPLRRLQWKIYQMEQRRGGSYPSLALVKAIVARFKGQSVLGGGGGGDDDLCAVRYFAGLPLHRCPWNAVLVTAAQARHLPRRERERQRRFPAWVQEEMTAQQQQQEGDALGASTF